MEVVVLQVEVVVYRMYDKNLLFSKSELYITLLLWLCCMFLQLQFRCYMLYAART